MNTRAQAGVRRALVPAEIEVQRDRVEAGEESPRQIGDGELEDRGPDQLGEAGDGGRVTWRSGREAEASDGQGHLEGLVAQAATEVVDLVDDQEVEAIPEQVHVPVGALERGDHQRRHLVDAVAIAAHRVLVDGTDLAKPLIEQDTRRDEAQGAERGPLDGREGDAGLAAARRERDDAAVIPELPRGQRGLLVGPEVDIRPCLRSRPRSAGKVQEADAGLREPALEGMVADGRRPMRANASVPESSGSIGKVEVRGRISDQDRASVELQLHDRGVRRA